MAQRNPCSVFLKALLLPALLTGLSAESSDAQIRGSEPGMMQQTIDGTVFTVEYYRPRARGRAPLFGHDAVVWEPTWTPGANWATTFEFQKDITLDGHDIPAGKYGVWMDMSEAGFLPETLILEPEVLLFHTTPPERNDAQIRMPITRSEGPFREVLTWEFEGIASTGGVLALRWGTMRMAFEVGVQPGMRMTVTEEEGRPASGVYHLSPPPGAPPMPAGMSAPSFTITMHEDGTLWGDMEGIPGPDGEFMNSVALRLLPFADGIFKPAEYYNDAVQEVWEAFLELNFQSGVASGFVIRDEVTDEIIMSAERGG